MAGAAIRGEAREADGNNKIPILGEKYHRPPPFLARFYDFRRVPRVGGAISPAEHFRSARKRAESPRQIARTRA
jgi:hypothetical protein